MIDDAGTDRSLVEGYLLNRDEGFFLEIYRRHNRALYHLCVGMTGSPDAAADIVQETWMRAAKRLASFTWSSSLKTWLCGIAINCCRETWTRRSGDADGVVCESPGLPAEERIDLMEAIRDLPDRSRAVLTLHDVLGYTHAEIGAKLEIDPGTSKSQLSYARSRLRDWFEQRRKGGVNVE